MARAESSLAAVSASSAAVKSKSRNKRKSIPQDDEDDSGSDDGSDVSMINVDFDFYNLNEDVDRIATKRLLRQHLSHDDELVDVHALATLILSEATRQGAGSSIKTDGEESDPWALLAAVEIGRNQDDPGLKPFLSYLLSRIPSSSKLQAQLSPSPTSSSRTALIFSLRMLNLPLPLIPPMYKMLLSELAAAGAEYDHFVIWGRGYRLEGSEESMGLNLDQQSRGKKKKSKETTSTPIMAKGSFPYHPEEGMIDQLAEVVQTYPLESAPKRDDDDAFGVEHFGRLVLIDKKKLEQAIRNMGEAAGQGS